VLEEGGFPVTPEQIQLLGAPFFLAAGSFGEDLRGRGDVTGLPQRTPEGDGSPMKRAAPSVAHPTELFAAFASGEIQDAKTELILHRFLR